MKHFIFNTDEFNQEKFLEELGKTESADVKLRNPDGTHTRMSFTPAGVAMTVGQLIDLCNESPNTGFAAEKLKSVKGLSPAIEIVIDVAQLERLKTVPSKASDAETAQNSLSNVGMSPNAKEIPPSTSEADIADGLKPTGIQLHPIRPIAQNR